MPTLEQIIEDRAEKDGLYAIAYALLCVNARLGDLRELQDEFNGAFNSLVKHVADIAASQ